MIAGYLQIPKPYQQHVSYGNKAYGNLPVFRSDMQNPVHVVGMDPITYWVLLATIVAGGVVIYTWRKLTPTQQHQFAPTLA